jgi:hypothetical protein
MSPDVHTVKPHFASSREPAAPKAREKRMVSVVAIHLRVLDIIEIGTPGMIKRLCQGEDLLGLAQARSSGPERCLSLLLRSQRPHAT